MRGRSTWPALIVAALLVMTAVGFEAGSRWTQLNIPIARPIRGQASSGPSRPVATGSPAATASPAAGNAEPAPTRDPAAFVAPVLREPLRMLDRGLATRGPRPTLAQLMDVQYGNSSILIVARDAGPRDWRLSQPDPLAVRGYGSDISVAAGGSLGLHLAGRDPATRIDVFRMGLGDAHRVLAVPSVHLTQQADAQPDPTTGRIEDTWPVSYTIRVPANWRSGVYLAKLTGTSGGQSYVIFVVRAAAASPLTVVLPTMTWQAYNDEGGTDLYGWYGGPRPRAYEASFDRPFNHEYGAGLFFRLDFPLLVWLEDHGYQPTYVTDVDLARNPHLADGATTLAFSGHGEYWTGDLRDTVDRLSGSGTSLLFFGANQAFWQARLTPDRQGTPNRTIVCYKEASLDPETASSPSEATTRFQDPPVNRPPSALMGLEYGGIVAGISPMVIGSGIEAFAPDLGLHLGQSLPGLVADEIDQVPRDFDGVLLGATPVDVREHAGSVTSGAALWINAAGGRVFDAGTFDFSWGLDPRFAAALPGFPAESFSQLTARILAWAGSQPVQ